MQKQRKAINGADIGTRYRGEIFEDSGIQDSTLIFKQYCRRLINKARLDIQ